MSGNDNEQKTKASKNDSCLKSFKLRKKIEPLHISSVRQRRCSMDRTGGGEWAGQAMGNGQGRQWGMDMAGSGYIPGADVVLGVHHFR